MSNRMDLDAILPDDVFCWECGERIDADTVPVWSLNVPLCKTCWLINKHDEEV